VLDLLGENNIKVPVLYSEYLIGNGQEMFERSAQFEVGRHCLEASRRAVSI
jgi:hypothetical protein